MRAPTGGLRNALALPALATIAFCTGCRPPADEASNPAAAPGRTLRRALGAEPGTLDPRRADDNAALAVIGDLYEGLSTEARDGSIVPGAAEAWTVAADGQMYSFTLREGLRWSNGDPLIAAHFAAGLRAVIAPDSVAPSATLFEAVAGVEAPDDRTLRIELRRPLAHLPALLAMPVAAPLHPDHATSGATPVNGAYRVLKRLPGERIELERNPHYRAAPSVAIDRVDHLTVTDIATELRMYRAGDLDMTSEVPNAQLEFVRSNLAGELHVSPYLSTYAYAVNLARLPDRAARAALAMAIDRERITGQVTGAGEAPAFGWVPDGIPGYVPARFEWSALPYDKAGEQARRLWDAARESGAAPERLKLCTDASENHHRTAVAVADLWRTSLGVATEIVELEWQVYLDTRRHPGDCDLVRLGWSADFVDPEAFATVFETGSPQDTLGYSNATYDALLHQSRLTSDSVQRMESLAMAEAQLLADVPVIPVFFRVSKRLVKPYVHGVGASPLGHIASRDLDFASH